MSKIVSTLLLVVAAVLTLWRGTEAFVQLWSYLKLDQQVKAKIESWQIKELSPSKYILVATCTFTYSGKKWETLPERGAPTFPNRYAAQSAIGQEPSGETTLWIASSAPEYSAWERLFPWKSFFYALTSLIIFLYFVYINGRSRFLGVGGDRRDKRR